MLRKSQKEHTSFPHVLGGNPYNGCPTKAFGHDDLIILGTVSKVRNITY